MITILDFYTTWCAPCKRMDKIIYEIQEEIKDIDIKKINIESNEYDEYEKHHIKGVPTLIFFKDGEQVKRINGTMTKKELTSIINGINNQHKG